MNNQAINTQNTIMVKTGIKCYFVLILITLASLLLFSCSKEPYEEGRWDTKYAVFNFENPENHVIKDDNDGNWVYSEDGGFDMNNFNEDVEEIVEITTDSDGESYTITVSTDLKVDAMTFSGYVGKFQDWVKVDENTYELSGRELQMSDNGNYLLELSRKLY